MLELNETKQALVSQLAGEWVRESTWKPALCHPPPPPRLSCVQSGVTVPPLPWQWRDASDGSSGQVAVLGSGRQRLSATAIRKTALLIDGDSYVYL
jgi:hypothetical protein